MLNRPILIVDDEPLNLAALQSVLSDQYQLVFARNGQEALAAALKHLPSLILLDIQMPGMDGYEVCRNLRNESALDDLPVVFISSMVDEKSRLAGYEAGGNDYLTKPIVPGELLHKVDRLLKSYAERQCLKKDLADTFATAMTAMSTAGEIGSVLHFLRASFNCPDYQSLCQELINILGNYGLEGSVQIRGKQGITSLGSNGECSPLEESVLNHLFGHGRLFEFSSCLSCSFEHVTIIVRDLVRDDPELRGRMRDNIALLAEGANVRIAALDSNAEVAKQNVALTSLIANITRALEDIEKQQKHQRFRSDQIFQQLQQTFDLRLISLGLSESQENELTDMISAAVEQSLSLFDEFQTTEEAMESILRQLQNPSA
jgi:CheY-like chemotaxis protein